MSYTYFIYFTFTKFGNTCDGNTSVTVDTKIKSLDDIREIEFQVCRQENMSGTISLVITNWILLDKTTGGNI